MLMGLSVPFAIGAAVADKKRQILAVTGDGSLELNIQELKTCPTIILMLSFL